MTRRLFAAVAAVAASVVAVPAATAAVHYSSAPFEVHTSKVSFGQAPVFMTDGYHVLYGQDYKQGVHNQVYRWNVKGAGQPQCLTCTGPGSSADNVNGVPAVRPQGDWVVFHSWRGHYMTIGSPGYGGMGSALWVMRPDGSHQTQLSDVQAPSATPGSGEGVDDYHAYWSADGRELVYAHLNWNFVSGGGQGKWDVRVADFRVRRDGTPYLTNVRVVRPDNGHWYETQWWAPATRDHGHGFLYTESYGKANTDAGAVTPQLFYCKLVDHDSKCDVTRLSDEPSWDEQAIFTPDGKEVIFMSSRDHPGFFNTWASETRTLGLPSEYDYLGILPVFEVGFLQPVGQEATDLYEINLNTRAVRRLTTDGDDGWITPEFGWDPSHRHLVWTENRFPDGYHYPLPPSSSYYLYQLETLAQHPPTGAVDVGQNGVGVAPLPVEQRTQVGAFKPSAHPKNRRRHHRQRR